jgi:VanZ family protein
LYKLANVKWRGWRDIFSFLTLLIAIIIAFLSLLPPDKLPQVAGSDKTHHFIAYGSLTFSWLMALHHQTRQILMILVLANIFGTAIEFLQPYTHRSFDYLDILANFLGAGTGLAVGLWLKRVISVPSGAS